MVDWLSLDYAKWRTADSGEPLYRRIVALVRQLISEGALAEGDLLPPERDLARLMGVSRGTVTQAFKELQRERIVAAAPGRGTVVASDQYVNEASRKEQAIRILTNALERCEALGFAARDVEAFLHLVLLGRTGQDLRVRALLVECNPEALALLADQLGRISHLEPTPRLLDDLAVLGPDQWAAFDLVLTTETHAGAVTASAARLGFPLSHVLSLAVAPGRETLVATARLPLGSPLVVHARSARFGDLMRAHLVALGHAQIDIRLGGHDDPHGLIQTADGTEVPFGYEVDRGTLLRVEEAVTALLLRKGEGMLDSQAFASTF